MNIASETATTAFRVLHKYSDELEAEGPWKWRCVVRNGTRLRIAAALKEGFLELSCFPSTTRRSADDLERALMGNRKLTGGVRVALNGCSNGLHLRTDIVVLEEKQLLERLDSALHGFRDGNCLLKPSSSRNDAPVAQASFCDVSLGDVLRESSWLCTERSQNDFSVVLAAESAPPASIRIAAGNLVVNVELVRCDATARVIRHAMSVFLLTTSSAIRLAGAYAVEADEHVSFGLQVILPALPAAEEIEHAISALSVAYRMCVRETNVLLNDGAARYYLTARGVSTTDNSQPIKEN